MILSVLLAPDTQESTIPEIVPERCLETDQPVGAGCELERGQYESTIDPGVHRAWFSQELVADA